MRHSKGIWAAALLLATPVLVRVSASEGGGGDAEHTVVGEVESVRRAAPLDREHVVVQVGVDAMVDLGLAEALGEEVPRPGAWIVARGDETHLLGRRVMLARSYRLDRGIERLVERPAATIEGRVGEVRSADVQGREHVLVQLRPPKPPTEPDPPGASWIADLGPRDALDAALERDDPVIVRGAPAGLGDARVLLASELTHAGRTIEIRR